MYSRDSLPSPVRLSLEEPGFGVVRNIARSLNIKINAVPVDDEGLVVSALNDCPDKIKVVYITPNHQDPTGAKMSPARRRGAACLGTQTQCLDSRRRL
ncbi:MAG: hypothetical protein IPL73_00010 [Candidatus Obscuribacter sp.]|nr:hypothetical protein [Candidatus Obscuribacter sp.]